MKKEIKIPNPNDPRNVGVTNPADIQWIKEDLGNDEDAEWAKVFIGKVIFQMTIDLTDRINS